MTKTLMRLTIAGGLVAAGCAGDSSSFGREAADYEPSAPVYPGAPPSTDAAERGETGEPATPAPDPRDRYENVGTNPFVTTSHDPFSTFAADVDTASYDIFVRDVGSYGDLPDPLSVRLEEYVNAFEYDYPAPTAESGTPFSIHLQAAPHIMGHNLALLRVGIQGQEPPEHTKRPTNLVFLIDVSGSMTSAEKLPYVKALLNETLTVLDPDDTVSIVTYASGTGVRLEPTAVRDASVIRGVINGLAGGGSTNGAGGIQLAYQQAEDAFLEGGINHVVLCTDGDFNVGVSDTNALVELIEEKRETGVTLTALGFGRGNLNDAMMERVSNAGNGIYSVIASEDHAIDYAREDMLRTINHIASDMKIQVEFNPAHILAYRLLGYENRAIADDQFRDDSVDAGEVGAGHRVTALYELVLSDQMIPSPEGAPDLDDGEPVEGTREIEAEEMVQVRVRYRPPAAPLDYPSLEVKTGLLPSQLQTLETVDQDFAWAAAIAAFAEVLKESPFASEALDAMESIFRAQRDRDDDRREFWDLFRDARDML